MPTTNPTFLELKTWRLHNSKEDQASRLADYLESGLSPALARSGAKLLGAFSTVIGPDAPCYFTLVEYPSLGAMQDTLTKIAQDQAHHHDLAKLESGDGMPFVRIESTLLRSFTGMPASNVPETAEKRPPRIFEMRTYESQTYLTLARKIAMFNDGEMQIFERLGMRPVFFGEAIVGAKQPHLTYMLSFDDLGSRDKLWQAFVSDPEWKKMSTQPQNKDSELVTNITNVILRPLTFSALR